MSDGNTIDNFTISEVIGSLQFGRLDKKGVVYNTVLVLVGVAWLLLGVILYPLLYIDEKLTLMQFIAVLVTFAFIGLFCTIYSGICLIKMMKGKALLRRCLEEGDLHRSCASVIVTTKRGFRSIAIITLRFKVSGKKYEKRNLKNIPYAEKYYNIDILYSLTHDEVFLLKMD